MRKLIAAILLLALVISVGAPASALSPAVQRYYSKEANSGIRHEICTDLYGTSVDTYYTDGYLYDELMALSGAELLQTLRTLLTDTHTYQTSYDECRDLSVITDSEGRRFESYRVGQTKNRPTRVCFLFPLSQRST